MKKVARFLSDDGQEYKNEEEAIRADQIHMVREHYEQNPIHQDFSCVEWQDFLEWVVENKRYLQLLLNLV